MTLTIDGRSITTLISNSQEEVQNEFINRQRNLNGSHITQKLIDINFRDEFLILQSVSSADLDFLRSRNGEDVECSLTGVGLHNFFNIYNLELNSNTQKSYNGTQNIEIGLRYVSLPSSIIASVDNYKSRFASASEYQVLALTNFLKDVYLATGGILPDFLAHPEFSFNLADPASTTFYNAGSFNGGDGVIQNTNTGDLVKDGLIDTSAFVGNEFIATTMPNVTGQFSIITKAQPLNFSATRDLWGNGQNENVRMTLRNTATLRYTIRGVDDVVESSNLIVSTGFNTLAIGQSDIEAFSQVINADTSVRTTAAKTTLPTGNENANFLRDSTGSEYRGTVKYLMTFNKSLTNQEVQAINNL